YPFVRYEYINTQKETVRRYNGGSEDVQDFICANVLAGSCNTTAQLTNQNQDLGIIAAADSFKEAYGVTGVADRVNDRRIVTIGLAYFPVDQVVLKADYERWESKTDYHTDIAGRNPDNNKVDRFNFAVGFIF
ncbi:MAG: hypothetical protein KDK34_20805, partial [Leptospiraceae bacterium]|nr:hypothetical protein [Leptospiraceae bacterium]